MSIGQSNLIRGMLMEAFPPSGATPPSKPKAEIESICRVFDWNGPPGEFLLTYPKERQAVGYWLWLRMQGKYNPNGHRPSTLGITYQVEQRMTEQNLVENSFQRLHAKQNLWLAYDCTYYWFKHMAAEKEQDHWFDMSWLSLYKYTRPRYITKDNQRMFQKKPWAMLEGIAKDMKLNQHLLHPDPASPTKDLSVVAKEHGISDWRNIPERLFIPNYQERVWLIHMYDIYTNEGKRIVMPLHVLPRNQYVQDNLQAQGLIELRNTDNGPGAVITKKGTSAYEVTYYHMIMTGRISQFNK